MGAESTFIVSDDAGDDRKQPRAWRAHWCCFLGRCGIIDWSACCLAHFLPCISFGWNSHKALRKNMWLEALKYIAVLGICSTAWFILDFTKNVTCGLSAESSATDDEKLAAYNSCAAVFAPYIFIVMVATSCCTLYWATCVGGPRRRQIRQSLGIPVRDDNGRCCHLLHDNSDYCNSDCCLHYWCLCCALAQETRTILEDEKRREQEEANAPAGYQLLKAPLVEGTDGMKRATAALPV